MQRAEHHHWLNTLVGLLDQAFYLTEDEQFHVIRILSSLLDDLSIPERGVPDQLPPTVLLEVASGYYTNQLSGPRSSGVMRHARLAGVSDIVVPLETWREFLLGMLTLSYPDLDGFERIAASKRLTDLLGALGVPGRAASFIPDDCVRVARSIDDI